MWKTWLQKSPLLAKSIFSSTVRPLHSLWHEVIGFLFIALAIIPAFRLIRRFQELGTADIVVSILFIAIMGYYGVSSFWRARRISRS